jgi:tight adherence protein B
MSMVASHDSFWTSTPALVLVAFGCALLVTLALFALLGPRLRRHDVRARVGQFTVPLAPSALQPAAELFAAAPTREWTDRLFEGRPWWDQFKEKLELARIERPAGEIVLATAIATVAMAMIVSLAAGTPVLAIPMLGLGPAAMLALVNRRLARQRERFGEQLPSHLQELASAMRAGHSLVGGLRTLAESAVEPMRTELERVLADEQLGVPLQDALRPMARRMACEDIQQVALVAALHERTGGNMAAVLDHVADGVRERTDLGRELRSLTAQARLSRWIVTLLPPALLLLISIVNRSYVQPLFHTTTGVLLLLIATGLVIAGSVVMKIIVNVEA